MRNIGKSYNMHVKHNFQVSQYLCTLFQDLYIDFFSYCLHSPINFEVNSHSLELCQRISD